MTITGELKLEIKIIRLIVERGNLDYARATRNIAERIGAEFQDLRPGWSSLLWTIANLGFFVYYGFWPSLVMCLWCGYDWGRGRF